MNWKASGRKLNLKHYRGNYLAGKTYTTKYTVSVVGASVHVCTEQNSECESEDYNSPKTA